MIHWLLTEDEFAAWRCPELSGTCARADIISEITNFSHRVGEVVVVESPIGNALYVTSSSDSTQAAGREPGEDS